MVDDTPNNDPSGKKVGNYYLYEEINRGSYAVVYRGEETATRKKVAIKVVAKARVVSSWNQKQIKNELELSREMQHPNICSIIDAMQTEKRVYMVFELAQNDLYNLIVNDGPLTELEAKTVFKQMVYGLEHMHSKNVVHRDLKPENILLKDSKDLKVMICDLGFAERQPKDKLSYAMCGSPLTISPEVCQTKYGLDKGYDGYASDIWSLGIILYVILHNRYPFPEKSNGLPDYISLEINPCFSTRLHHLLNGILDKNYQTRMTLEEIKSHPWLN